MPEGIALNDLIQQQVDECMLVQVDETDDLISEAKEKVVLTYRTPDGGDIIQLLEMCDSYEAAVSMVRALERQYVAEGFHQVATRRKIVSKQNKELIGEGVMLGEAAEGRIHSIIEIWNNYRLMVMVTAQERFFETAMFCSSSKY